MLKEVAQEHQTEATKYSAYVNIDNDQMLDVREKASTNSNKLGSLTNRTKVTVIVKDKNGWTTIRYNNKNAYVLSKYLTPSFKKDPSLIYTYMEYGQKTTYNFLTKEDNDWDSWEVIYNITPVLFSIGENGFALGSGYPEREVSNDLFYPIEKGKTWTNEFGLVFEIVNEGTTVKTKAGTFKNAVVIKQTMDFNDSAIYDYYVPYIGEVLRTSEGKNILELIAIEKR